MRKKLLAALNADYLYKARQLQAIGYASIALNVVLILTLVLIMRVK